MSALLSLLFYIRRLLLLGNNPACPGLILFHFILSIRLSSLGCVLILYMRTPSCFTFKACILPIHVFFLLLYKCVQILDFVRAMVWRRYIHYPFDLERYVYVFVFHQKIMIICLAKSNGNASLAKSFLKSIA
jgi:hypothetical protein